MYLEIVSPEAKIFSAEVDSVTVPGISGEFQMLNNHAAIVSLLAKGIVKIHTHSKSHLAIDNLDGSIKVHNDDDKILTYKLKSGTIEMKNNKVIILAD